MRAAVFVGVMLSAAAAAAKDTLIEFELKDQFDNVYTHERYAGRTVIVVGSDKGGTDFNRIWSRAIHDSLEAAGIDDRVDFLPLADLRGVPFFIKGMVRRKFPKKESEWAMMDWKGRFAEAYGFQKDASNLLLFAPDGRLVHRTHGRELELQKLDNLLHSIRIVVKAEDQ